jgi:ankyrin repeat protein
MSISFSAAGFVQRVLALGPEFTLYATALSEKKTVDSAFFQNLADQEIGILFAFIPQAHQAKLESLFSVKTNALPSLAWNSADDDEILPVSTPVRDALVGSSSNFEGGGGSGGVQNAEERSHAGQFGSSSLDGGSDVELFLDLGGSSDDQVPSPETTKKKKKRTRKRTKKKLIKLEEDNKTKVCVPHPDDLPVLARLDKWLSQGAHLSKKQARQSKLLLRAATVGHTNAARTLLVNPHVRTLKEGTYSGWFSETETALGTALHMAARYGHSAIVELLVARADAQINQRDSGSSTPLLLASSFGHNKIVEILVLAGADTEARHHGGATSLFVAAQMGYLNIVRFLVEAGACVETTFEEQTPLYTGCYKGHVNIVKFLIEAGAMFKGAMHQGRTPLDAAAQEGHADVVKLLTESGADHAVGPAGYSPLHSAAANGHLEAVKGLLEAGADRNALCITKDQELTPLSMAAMNGHLHIVKFLVMAGARDHDTPLLIAAELDHMKIINFLVEAGTFENLAAQRFCDTMLSLEDEGSRANLRSWHTWRSNNSSLFY